MLNLQIQAAVRSLKTSKKENKTIEFRHWELSYNYNTSTGNAIFNKHIET